MLCMDRRNRNINMGPFGHAGPIPTDGQGNWQRAGKAHYQKSGIELEKLEEVRTIKQAAHTRTANSTYDMAQLCNHTKER